MATWEDGLNAIEAAESHSIDVHGGWRPGTKRKPIVVMGHAGAGKTEVWRHLTGKQAPDAMSTRVDQGYFRGVGQKTKAALAITTIPGQVSEERRADVERRFSGDTLLNGVIFVAAFGFDQIWPRDADGVASELDPPTIEQLSHRNIGRELESFKETCERIRDKYLGGGHTMTPRWLLVVVNKADLYWPGRDQASAYYRPGTGSPFDLVAHKLKTEVGELAAPRYEVMPLVLRPGPYSFRSNKGAPLEAESHLDDRHAAASRRYLMERLEELSGI
jgi:hypothetical protein